MSSDSGRFAIIVRLGVAEEKRKKANASQPNKPLVVTRNMGRGVVTKICTVR